MKDYKLWYDKIPEKFDGKSEKYSIPEDVWEKYAMPLGNGYFGACVFGYTDCERVQITENSLANPYLRDERDPTFVSHSTRVGLNNFAELYFDFGHSESEVESYCRELSLNNATSTVSYTFRGVKYTREFFASYPDRVFVMRFTADKDKCISFTARPEIPFIGDFVVYEGDGCSKCGEVSADGDTITLSGVMDYYGVKYEGQLKIIPSGGEMQTKGDKIELIGADSALVIFSCGTNYKMESRVFAEPDPKKKLLPYPHPHDAISSIIHGASELGFDTLQARALEDYSSLFARASVDLGATPDKRPTDMLLAAARLGEDNRYLEELLFAFGRYLLICSSRPGCYPANLQGIWNAYNSAPWSAGYWHNVNVQMNYWCACPANLSELFLPYSDYSEAFMPLARKNADTLVSVTHPERLGSPGLNGWTVATAGWLYNMEALRGISHSGPGTGGFTSLLFWDYYDYTRDYDFLRTVAYPRLFEMSRFLLKMLIEQDGKFLISPSASPEQKVNRKDYHTVGCAFDQQMTYENLKRTLEAAEILGESNAELEQMRSVIDKLDPVLIGESGQIKEYREERFYGEIGDPKHRHVSHLVGLYPGTVINSDTPDWLKAAEVTLNGRGDASRGWAVMHKMLLWARVKNGSRAHDLMRTFIENNLLDNLWDIQPPFQIDGNLGYVSGVCEMLLSSHADLIELLPALPDEWQSGEFSGLIARGGFEIDCKWEGGKPISASFRSKCGGTLKVDLSTFGGARATVCGKEIALDGERLTFDTKIGETVEISAK